MTFKKNTLVELCDIVSSKRVFAASYQSEGVPFFRGKEVSQLARGENTTAELYISNEVYNDVISRTGPINSGDILLTAVGTLGNPYQVKETDLPFYFKDGNIVWLRKFSKEINSTYLFYWLNSEYGRRKVLDTAIGSTQAALTITGLGAISISCPSLAQQTGIVRILSAIDQKITMNNALSKTLEDIAQTIFKSWFIDFDPVKAKMAEEKISGMDAATAALFPDSMEDSELGLIPQGWQARQLKSVLVLHKSTIKAGTATESVPYVPIDQIGSRNIFLKNSISGSEAKTSLVSFEKNEILFGAMRPYFHKVVLAPFDGTTRTTTFVLRAINPRYLAFSLLTVFQDSAVAYATNHSQGTTIPYAVWNNSFENYPIVFPSEKVATAFNDSVLPLIEYGYSLVTENQKLVQLRDGLLPRLISGELQIPEEMLAS
jgi:type I restriction enzyme S subunit